VRLQRVLQWLPDADAARLGLEAQLAVVQRALGGAPCMPSMALQAPSPPPGAAAPRPMGCWLEVLVFRPGERKVWDVTLQLKVRKPTCRMDVWRILYVGRQCREFYKHWLLPYLIGTADGPDSSSIPQAR